MKKTVRLIMFIYLSTFFATGCKEDPSVAALKAAVKNYKRQPDTDVTNLPEYNFSSFAGTMWKTKDKAGLGIGHEYNGRKVVYLLPASTFDRSRSDYRPIHEMELVAELPPGTSFRVQRLMKDNGMAGLIWVIVALEHDKTNKEVYLNVRFLAPNKSLSSVPTNWVVDSELLEEVK